MGLKKESVRSRMKVTVKRLLRRYGYPPDKKPWPPTPYSSRPNSSPKSGSTGKTVKRG